MVRIAEQEVKEGVGILIDFEAFRGHWCNWVADPVQELIPVLDGRVVYAGRGILNCELVNRDGFRSGAALCLWDVVRERGHKFRIIWTLPGQVTAIDLANASALLKASQEHHRWMDAYLERTIEGLAESSIW